jgi:hypothetical protein
MIRKNGEFAKRRKRETDTVARISKGAATVSPSPGGEGRDEGGLLYPNIRFGFMDECLFPGRPPSPKSSPPRRGLSTATRAKL